MSDAYQIYINIESPELVGSLLMHRSRCSVLSIFSYDEKWLRSRRCFPISPDLPLDVYPKTVEGLFSCFQDCSPDRWGRTLLNRAERLLAKDERRDPRILLDSDCLLHVSDDTRQGTLRIFDPTGQIFVGDGGKDAVPPLSQLSRMMQALDNLNSSSESKNDVMLLLAAGSSLGRRQTQSVGA